MDSMSDWMVIQVDNVVKSRLGKKTLSFSSPTIPVTVPYSTRSRYFRLDSIVFTRDLLNIMNYNRNLMS